MTTFKWVCKSKSCGEEYPASGEGFKSSCIEINGTLQCGKCGGELELVEMKADTSAEVKA